MRYLATLFLCFVCLISLAQVPPYVTTDGLVSWWSFDGNAEDAIGQNDGVVSGAILTQDRFNVEDRAYFFDGINGTTITVDNPMDGSLDPGMGSFTVSGWIASTDSTTANPIAEKKNGSGYVLFISLAGEFKFYVEDEDANLMIAISPDSSYYDGMWHHAVGIRDAEQDLIHLWVDGQLVATIDDETLSGSVSSEPLYFGEWGQSQYETHGSLDEIGYWNRALSAEEVVALFEGCVLNTSSISGPQTPEVFIESNYTCDGDLASTYEWSITNGVITSGQGTNSVTVIWAAEGLGTLSVVETNSIGCTGESIVVDVVVLPTSVDKHANVSIQVYPNPAQFMMNIELGTDMMGSKLSIYDLLGQKVHEQRIEAMNTSISLEDLSTGEYFMVFEKDQTLITRSLVIRR